MTAVWGSGATPRWTVFAQRWGRRGASPGAGHDKILSNINTLSQVNRGCAVITNIIMFSPCREHLALAGHVTETEDVEEEVEVEEEEEGGWVMLMLMGRMILGGVEELFLRGELFILEQGSAPVY